MANVNIKDGANADKYLKATGAGSDGDPFIPEQRLSYLRDSTSTTPTLDTGTPSNNRGLPVVLMGNSAAAVLDLATLLGANSDSASATGSYAAKLRQIAEALTGASAAAATATISSGTAVTGSITLNGRSLLAVKIPSTWTTANLAIQVTFDGSTWDNLRTEAGGLFVIATTTAGSCYDITQSSLLSRLGVPFRFRSCNAATPTSDVNQGADRTLNYIYA